MKKISKIYVVHFGFNIKKMSNFVLQPLGTLIKLSALSFQLSAFSSQLSAFSSQLSALSSQLSALSSLSLSVSFTLSRQQLGTFSLSNVQILKF